MVYINSTYFQFFTCHSTVLFSKVGRMKSAVFALASLVFALGLAGTLGNGYGSYGGYDSYGAGYGSGNGNGDYSGYSGYGNKMRALETTIRVPYAVPVPQPMMPAPAFGAVGGQSDGLFGGDSDLLTLALPFFFLLLLNNNNNNSG